MLITFRKLLNSRKDYFMIYNWCQNDFVYTWFEQRILSYEEIEQKYKKKILSHNQNVFIIRYDKKDIGLVQIYRYDYGIENKEINQYKNVYEFDLFIGEKDYLHRGIGEKVVNIISNKIFDDYNADAIILRPFKENIIAFNCYKKCNYKFVDYYDGFDTLGNNTIISVLIKTKDMEK